MRTALYIRVSTDDQTDRQLPLETQLERCREHAQAQGWEVAAELKDAGYSGTTDERPGLQELLHLATAGEIQAVIVWDLSRLARDDRLFGHLSWILDRAGVAIVSVSEPGASRLEIGIRAVMAGQYVESIRAAIIRSMRSKASRREYTGGKRLYGYRWKDRTTREIVPAEAAIVRRIFDDYLAGRPLSHISRDLDLNRLRLWRILRHPGYAGAYTYGRAAAIRGKQHRFRRVPREQWVISWDAHPPIVPRETWERCQERMDAQKRRWPKSTGVPQLALSGILKCWLCETDLRVCGYHRQKSSGTARYYYRCPRDGAIPGTAKECSGVGRLRTDGWVKGIIVRVLERAASRAWTELLAEEIRQAHDSGRRIGELEAEVRKRETVAKNIFLVLNSGEVSDTRALARELEETQKAAESARAVLRAERRRVLPEISPGALRARLREMSRVLSGIPELPGMDRAARPMFAQWIESVRVHHDGRAMIRMRLEGIMGTRKTLLRADVRGLQRFQALEIPWELPARAA